MSKESKVILGVIEVKANEVNYQGKKFMGYKMKRGNRFVNLKLRRDCKNQPAVAGDYKFKIDMADLNEDKNAIYPTFWLSDIIEYKAMTTERVADAELVAEFSFDDEDLPF